MLVVASLFSFVVQLMHMGYNFKATIHSVSNFVFYGEFHGVMEPFFCVGGITVETSQILNVLLLCPKLLRNVKRC